MKQSASLLLLLLAGCQGDCLESERCRLEPESGPCFAAFQRYYYDAPAGRCRQFIWGGCGGVVPFETLEACQQACTCGR